MSMLIHMTLLQQAFHGQLISRHYKYRTDQYGTLSTSLGHSILSQAHYTLHALPRQDAA